MSSEAPEGSESRFTSLVQREAAPFWTEEKESSCVREPQCTPLAPPECTSYSASTAGHAATDSSSPTALLDVASLAACEEVMVEVRRADDAPPLLLSSISKM